MGKTTLSRIIAGDLDYSGDLETGHNVALGYFAQHQTDRLQGDHTLLKEMEYAAAQTDAFTRIRGILGAFLFSGEEVEKKIKVLSGGEKARLSMAKLLLTPLNFLILDEQCYAMGFRAFFMDEVHRYQFWSRDLKQLYDDFEDIHLVATGSSLLDLSKGQADLSRRAVVYHLHGLTFREYLLFDKKVAIQALDLETILTRHHEITADLLDQFSFGKDFSNYLKQGYFPFFKENKSVYVRKLSETLHLGIDIVTGKQIGRASCRERV